VFRDTHGHLRKRLAAERVVHLVLPVAFYARKDFFLWHILDLDDVIVLGVVFEDDALDLVLCPSEPALLEVFENDLQACLGAGDVAGVGNGDTERACSLSADGPHALVGTHLAADHPNTLPGGSAGTPHCPCSSA
jgi:hypothetical protein